MDSPDSQQATPRYAELSAFGSTVPVHDRDGERVRWFCPRPLRQPGDIDAALTEVDGFRDAGGVSRITVRLLCEQALADGMPASLGDRGYREEARMRLGPGRAIAYVAWNHPSRRPTPSERGEERAIIDQVCGTRVWSPRKILDRFSHAGEFCLELARPDELPEADTERLVALHHAAFPTFPYDFGRKLPLMRSSPDDYLCCLVRSLRNGQLYSFSNLEFNRVSLAGGGTLLLAEYDNTLRADPCEDHPVLQGLGAVVRLRLAQAAAGLGVDLCHAESRAGLTEINRISRQIGMRFGGTLEKHLLISGRRDFAGEPSRYESMNVWYLNRSALDAL